MIQIAVIVAVGVLCIIVAIVIDDIILKVLLSFLGVFFIGVTMYSLGIRLGKEFAYKEALKGNNHYKMEVRYELQDSIYISKDTVFAKIEK